MLFFPLMPNVVNTQSLGRFDGVDTLAETRRAAGSIPARSSLGRLVPNGLA